MQNGNRELRRADRLGLIIIFIFKK